nr:heterogeneous nuclear ribonucleoprotein 1-like [Ipomoea batatas]
MEPGKLFVGGISWDTNEDGLREYFQTFGEIVEAVIMKDRTTGRARGFGFVVFADPSVAERVVKEKHMIDGRTVEAKKAVPRDDHHGNRNSGVMQSSPGSIRTKKIFVGGLASSVTESDFKRYFDQFGTITDVVVMYDHNTQRPRGFGFITYDSEEAVDKVLYKTFHELNGKMVEVKRAVPKELSPGPIRSPLGPYNFGLNRVQNLLSPYNQGYSPSSIGSYGVRMDRTNPTAIGLNRYSSFNPSSYSMGLLDSTLNSNNGGGGNFSPNLGYGRIYGGNSARLNGLMGYASGRIGSGSMLNSTVQNMLDNDALNYTTQSANYNNFVGLGSGNTGFSAAAFGGLETIWDSSIISGQGRRNGSPGNDLIGYNNASVGGYGPYNGNTAGETSTLTATGDVRSANFGSLYGTGNGSFFEDQTWHSLSPELEGSGSFRYGLESMASDVIPKNSLDYVNAYSITNRSNTGTRISFAHLTFRFTSLFSSIHFSPLLVILNLIY